MFSAKVGKHVEAFSCQYFIHMFALLRWEHTFSTEVGKHVEVLFVATVSEV